MKKRLQLFIILSGTLISSPAFSQSSEFLTVNNIKAKINANSLFLDQSTAGASFEAPSGSGSHSIYSASLWLAGKDPVGTIKTNVNTYYNSAQKIAGPIMTSSLYATEGGIGIKFGKFNAKKYNNL